MVDHSKVKYIPLNVLYELWDILGDVPTNDGDEIEIAYLNFPIGTSRYEIWNWFESVNDKFICGEVMEGKRQTGSLPLTESWFYVIL